LVLVVEKRIQRHCSRQKQMRLRSLWQDAIFQTICVRSQMRYIIFRQKKTAMEIL